MQDTMTLETDSDSPVVYEIRLSGHLDRRWADWLSQSQEDVTIKMAENGETVLSSKVVDQAALFGLLRKVRDLGLVLLSVSRLPS